MMTEMQLLTPSGSGSDCDRDSRIPGRDFNRTFVVGPRSDCRRREAGARCGRVESDCGGNG
jgi:hypothetical protein